MRIHPDELSVVAPVWHDIYATRPSLPKPEIGTLQTQNKTASLVTARSMKEHDRMRLVLSHGFSERALKEQEPIIQSYVDLLIAQLLNKTIVSGEQGVASVNIGEWYSFTTFDIIGDLAFGESFHSLENSRHHDWVNSSCQGIKFATLMSIFDHFGPAKTLIQHCIPNSIRRKAHKFSEFSRKKIDDRLKQDSDRPDFLSFILQNKDKHNFTRDEIDSNVSLLIFAGSETSATACTSVTWFLLKNPATLERLQNEIRGSFDAMGDITISAVSPLPYLHAVIQEGLRLHPPAPIAFPREVDRPGVIVHGQEIPVGVSIVS